MAYFGWVWGIAAYKLGFFPSDGAAVFPSYHSSSCCFSEWAHTDLDPGECTAASALCLQHTGNVCLHGSIQPWSPALLPWPGESSGKAGQNRFGCLLLLWTEIWLFTENQGVKGGSTSSGLCVRAACRVTVWAGMVQVLPSSSVALPSPEKSWGKVREPHDLPKGLWAPSTVSSVLG